MVIPVEADLKQILEHERAYRWPRPACCPRCRQARVWGHGFVRAYFDEHPVHLLLRRFRCPGCGCVMRLRPAGYFARFQASRRRIFASISQRLISGRYLPELSRSRQRHWVRALQRQVRALLGEGYRERLLEGFEALVQQGRVPVAARIESAAGSIAHRTYRRLSSTGAGGLS
jgi:hypothetical protein